MTEKLYYTDSHIKEFDASVISCEAQDGKYLVELDRTAFFPEGGGNPADIGTLGGVRVLHTEKSGARVLHVCDGPLEAGICVHGAIDWEGRFKNMQNHTAEHIVSGLIHARFGYDNVGFHMGADGVTVDLNGFIEDVELAQIERAANQAVWRDAAVTQSFPSPEELPGLVYRSKLDLTEDVRLVTVEGVDVCACCAPHVKRTGEIGAIKLYSPIRRRGGVRFRLIAGSDAYEDYAGTVESASAAARLLSVQKGSLASGVERLLSERDQLSYRTVGLVRQLIELKLAAIEYTQGDLLFFEPGFDNRDLTALASAASLKCSGAAVCLAGSDAEGYRYVIASANEDLRGRVKEANASLNGRGGGKPGLVTGSFRCSKEDIERYFGRVD